MSHATANHVHDSKADTQASQRQTNARTHRRTLLAARPQRTEHVDGFINTSSSSCDGTSADRSTLCTSVCTGDTYEVQLLVNTKRCYRNGKSVPFEEIAGGGARPRCSNTPSTLGCCCNATIRWKVSVHTYTNKQTDTHRQLQRRLVVRLTRTDNARSQQCQAREFVNDDIAKLGYGQRLPPRSATRIPTTLRE